MESRTADSQFVGELFIRDPSWPVVIATCERFRGDVALSLGQRRVHVSSELFEFSKRDRPERAQIVENVLEILATEREDVVFALATRNGVRAPEGPVVLIDGRVRSTGRFTDEQVLVVEALDVLDVIGGFEHRLKRISVAA